MFPTNLTPIISSDEHEGEFTRIADDGPSRLPLTLTWWNCTAPIERLDEHSSTSTMALSLCLADELKKQSSNTRFAKSTAVALQHICVRQAIGVHGVSPDEEDPLVVARTREGQLPLRPREDPVVEIGVVDDRTDRHSTRDGDPSTRADADGRVDEKDVACPGAVDDDLQISLQIPHHLCIDRPGPAVWIQHLLDLVSFEGARVDCSQTIETIELMSEPRGGQVAPVSKERSATSDCNRMRLDSANYDRKSEIRFSQTFRRRYRNESPHVVRFP